jgi:mono/diheme cytochrome c family protein
MNPIWKRFGLALLLSLAATGCTQPNSADPQATPVGTSDTNRFWIFPNPGRDPATGVFTTNDASYAQAYYDAIDPMDTRATLDGFKITNGFGTTVAGVSEVNVIFRDAKDLGYGRKMTVRFTGPTYPGWPGTHWVAVFVENYQVVPFAGVNYSSLNLEAAITANANYHVGTNAIEYTTAPGGFKFAKFYTYAPDTDVRLDTVNLDGRGQKAMPSVCINCHGGRADPLLTFDAPVPGGGTTRFSNGGNVKARMQPIDVGSVEFWSTAPYRRIDQEEELRRINYAIFCTHSYPLAGPVAAGVDTCRPLPADPFGGNDYQGAAAEMMKSWYSAGAINTPGTAMADTYLPAGPGGITGWADASVAVRAINPISLAQQKSLYDNVVAPNCRVCHGLRGGENQSDINFDGYLKFENYADRIKVHVFNRGNMPLGLLIYNNFWDSAAPEQLADWLTSVNAAYNPARVGGAATGVPVQPGGPLTDPIFLAAAATNTTTYSIPGIYPTLAASFVKPTTFANIKTLLQDTNNMPCTACHYNGPSGVGYVYSPPIAYTNYDRNGDTPLTPNAADVNDDYEFYKALRGRVNLTDFLSSPLLRRPTTLLHGAGYLVLDTSSTSVCGAYPGCVPSLFGTYGAYNQAVYNTFLDWIEHGAPYSYTGSTPNY